MATQVSNLVRAIFLLVTCAMTSTLFAQGPRPDAPEASVEPRVAVFQPAPRGEAEHKFLDAENRTLFVAMAALNSADFAVTRANLQSGGQELNPLVRMVGTSTPALAVNFAGETAGVVSLSYFFHKTGHHRLERVVSIVNIGSSTGAVTYGLTHRGAKVTVRF